jgi:hypothetical protein
MNTAINEHLHYFTIIYVCMRYLSVHIIVILEANLFSLNDYFQLTLKHKFIQNNTNKFSSYPKENTIVPF